MKFRLEWLYPVALLALTALGGCGYRCGSLIPADVKTVTVRVAGNETFWREALKIQNLTAAQAGAVPRPAYTMEVDMTERIKNEVVRQTPLKLADAEESDSILDATITEVALHVLSRDPQDEVLLERVIISVDFIWTDRRTGRVIARGEKLKRPTDALLPRGETFTTAARTSFDYVAREIVEQMQEGF